MKFFNAVRKAKQIGDGTVGDLVDWLQTYINVLFPDNGIEYWSDNNHGDQTALRRFQPVPQVGNADNCVHHVFSYVRGGNNEGHVIELGMVLKNGQMKSLSWIKTFGKEAESWQIAQAISHALNSLVLWEEVPELVDLSNKLPRQQRWYRETNLTGTVKIATTLNSMTVITAGGQFLDQREWPASDPYVRSHMEPLLTDWKTVLTNMKAKFVEVTEKFACVPELPGYVISDRGVEGITGCYVLPPGGRPTFDCDYLGYFPTLDAAVTASLAHQASLKKAA